MKQPDICQVPDCSNPTLVGVGEPVLWVCSDHYDDYLRDAAALVARVKEAVAGARNV